MNLLTVKGSKILITWNIRPSDACESPGMNFLKSFVTVDSNQKPFLLT